jgi:hypothetical protein
MVPCGLDRRLRTRHNAKCERVVRGEAPVADGFRRPADSAISVTGHGGPPQRKMAHQISAARDSLGLSLTLDSDRGALVLTASSLPGPSGAEFTVRLPVPGGA